MLTSCIRSRSAELALVSCALTGATLGADPVTPPVERLGVQGSQDRVEGVLTINDTTFPLTHVYATRVPGIFDEATENTFVLLADQEVPPTAVSETFELMVLADEGKLRAVGLTIDEVGDVVSGDLYADALEEFGGHISVSGMHALEATTFGPARIEGTVSVEEPRDFFDTIWHYRADFAVSVSPGGPGAAAVATLTGTPLPDDGGEPGQRYLSYTEALQTADLDTLKGFVTSERAVELDEPDAEEMLEFVRLLQPSNIRIVRGAVDGDVATLEVEGTADGVTSQGTVTMVREDAAWKLSQESWRSFP